MRHVARLSLLPLLLLLVLLAGSCARAPAFREAKLREIDLAVEQAIAAKKIPGAVLWIEHRGAVYHRAYGNRALVPRVEAMTADTVFDVASLTKPVATASVDLAPHPAGQGRPRRARRSLPAGDRGPADRRPPPPHSQLRPAPRPRPERRVERLRRRRPARARRDAAQHAGSDLPLLRRQLHSARRDRPPRLRPAARRLRARERLRAAADDRHRLPARRERPYGESAPARRVDRAHRSHRARPARHGARPHRSAHGRRRRARGSVHDRRGPREARPRGARRQDPSRPR